MHDLRRLAVLLAVIDHGSFTAAADELHVSQPSVSQAITRLEREARLPLLIRDRTGVAATEAGALLAHHARQMIDQSRLAADQIAQLVVHHPQPARIGAYSSAMTTVLPGLLDALAADEQHETSIEAREGPVNQLIVAVASGQLDAAIGYDDPESPAETRRLVRTPLFDEPLEVALEPQHPATRQSTIDLADLADEAWLTPSTDHLLVRACRRAGFEPQVTCVARDVLAIRSLILAAGVVTLTPALLQRDLLPAVTRPLLNPVERRIFAVTAEPLTQQARALLTALLVSTEPYRTRTTNLGAQT